MDRSKRWTPAAHDACAENAGWGTRRYTTLSFEWPELNALRDVWFAIANKIVTSTRADFDTRTLKPFLRQITFVDRVCQADGPPRHRIRLQRSAITRLFGEQTGCFIDEFIPPQNFPRWTFGYYSVFDAGVPLRFISRFEMPRVSFLDGESFAALLASEREMPCGFLSALYMKPKASVSAKAG